MTFQLVKQSLNCFIDLKNVHEPEFYITKDSYTRWFQCRIAKIILGTKSRVFKMIIAADNLCTFYNNEVENLTHLFRYCPFTQEIDTFAVEIIPRRRPSLPFHLTCLDIVLGITNSKMNDLNFVCLEIKRYFYRHKSYLIRTSTKYEAIFWNIKQLQ